MQACNFLKLGEIESGALREVRALSLSAGDMMEFRGGKTSANDLIGVVCGPRMQLDNDLTLRERRMDAWV